MPWILLIVVLLGAIMLPGVWVKHVLKKYSEPADRYRQQGTGAEFARHLLTQAGLKNVKVEETERGDHYDPTDKVVRLTPEKFGGYSLTAITVAAHEVGHAVQDARNETMFNARQRLVRAAIPAERVGGVLMMAAPIAMLVTRAPAAGLFFLLIGLATVTLGALVHFVTLPVELDASFNKALPVLEKGGYLIDGDLPHARRILKAAALTYVAGSLASLLNLGRWIAVLRR